jgi:hypothetical protein
MRFTTGLCVAALLAAGSGAQDLSAQGSGNAAELTQKLNAQFTLTKTTADRSDIVTPGSVLVLHQDGLVMYSTAQQTSPLNIYRDGRIQPSAGNKIRAWGNMLRTTGSSSAEDVANIPQRKFVSGEKFWLTGITIQDDGLVLAVYSDPFNDVRYFGQLKFVFPKKSLPPTEDMLRLVSEVVSVQPADGAQGGASEAAAQPPQSQQPSQPPAAPLQAIVPPPPPPDQQPPAPKTIALGQTMDVVIATWGKPTTDIKLGSKEIFKYPDMKVTFVGGKVSNVE